MDNNPKWLNDALRTGDKIIREGEERNRALAREARLADDRPVSKQITDGIQALVAMAVGVVGLFVGGSSFGWVGALVLGAAGFVGTIFVFMFLGEKLRGAGESRLWKNRPQDRNRDDLKDYWEAKFGSPMREEVLDEIDLDGAAWVIDKKANFVLRMKTGERFYVSGPDATSLNVNQRGGKEFGPRDAWLMMLIRKSAGSETCNPNGGKEAMAYMWAAAKLLDIKVNGYQPDAKALEIYKQMESEFRPAGS